MLLSCPGKANTYFFVGLLVKQLFAYCKAPHRGIAFSYQKAQQVFETCRIVVLLHTPSDSICTSNL